MLTLIRIAVGPTPTFVNADQVVAIEDARLTLSDGTHISLPEGSGERIAKALTDSHSAQVIVPPIPSPPPTTRAPSRRRTKRDYRPKHRREALE